MLTSSTHKTNPIDRPEDSRIPTWMGYMPAGLARFLNKPTPRAWIELMRLDRPIGIWLCLWPAYFLLATYSITPWILSGAKLYVGMLVGAMLARAGGCIMNDILDQDIDKQTERTKHRPLPSGRVSLLSAIALMLACFGLAALLTFWLMGTQALLIAAFGVPLILLYPMVKRWSQYPQLFLGIVFNWGVFVVWGMQSTPYVYLGIPEAKFALVPLLIFGACFYWTVGFDTIYAFQDIEDDKANGTGSLAIQLQESGWSYAFIYAMYTGFVIFLSSVLWGEYLFSYDEDFTLTGPLLGTAVIAASSVYAVFGLDLNDRSSCLNCFRRNQLVGIGVFVGLCVPFLV